MDNYMIIDKEYIEDIDSEAIRLRHENSGARILILKNDNPYKYFNIAFLTPPYSSSGIPHIVEHSILAGSRKYPLGSYEKLYQSLCVGDIGAATAGDHTYYYCTTKDKDEYSKCIDLLLDSVFHPLFLQEESIFYKEGWRFDLSDNDEEHFDFNGIVYNEMRASDGEYWRRLRERVCKRLMPNSVYHHRTGGKSYKIPNCSNDELREYYRCHYNASNAFVYLYGDMNVEVILALLNEYLNDAPGEVVHIPLTTNDKKLIIKKEMINTEQEEDHKYCYACLFDGKVHPEQALALELMGTEIETVIEKTLDDLGIHGDASCFLFHSSVQDRFEVRFCSDLKNARKDVYKGIRKALHNDFKSDNGYRAQLMGIVNRYELSFRERLYSKDSIGEYLFEMIEPYWTYRDDLVFDVLHVSDNLQYIKNRLWGNFYNTFVSEILPEDGREILLECFPINRGDFYYEERTQKKLRELLSKLSEEEKDELKHRCVNYEEWTKRMEDDLPADTAGLFLPERCFKLPRTDYCKSEQGGVIYYHIPVTQSKVVWLTLSFDAHEYKDHLSELSLLNSFIENRPFNDFYGLSAYQAKRLLTQSIDVSLGISEKYNTSIDSDRVSVRVNISAVMLEENVMDVIRMIHHMLFDVFVAIPGYEETLKDTIDGLKNRFYSYPDNYVADVAGYNLSEESKYADQIRGIAFYRFLCALRDGGTDSLLKFYKNCYAMLNNIFNNNNLVVFCSSADRGFTLVKKALAEKSFDLARTEMFTTLERDYKRLIRREKAYDTRHEFKKLKKYILNNYTTMTTEKWFEHKQQDYNKPNIAVIIPSNINYISFIGTLDEYDYVCKTTSALRLATRIISDYYLRVELREKGGAYDYYANFYIRGALEIASYRAPNIVRTIETIQASAEFIANLSLDDVELEKIKRAYIGSLQDDCFDSALNVDRVRNFTINGMDHGYYDSRAEVINSCTLKDIQETAQLIQRMLDNGAFCVFGSRQDIDECSDIFDVIERLEDDYNQDDIGEKDFSR